jgi:hypothetical protein
LSRAFLQQRTQRFLHHRFAKLAPTSISLAFHPRQRDGCVTRHPPPRRKSNDIDHRANRYTRRDETTTKPRVGARRAHVATPKPKPRKKATPIKKAPTGRTKAQVAKPGARTGSKTAKILDLLRRPGGASAKELLKVTGWQPHSLRGFLSGTVGKKMGLALMSTKGEDGQRVYSLKT